MKARMAIAVGTIALASAGCSTPTLTPDEGVVLKVPFERRPNGDYVVAVAFSPSGLVAVGKGAEVQVWNPVTRKQVSRAVFELGAALGAGDVVRSLDFSPDGSRLACGFYGGALHVVDTATGSVTASVAGPQHQADHGEWDTVVGFDRTGERIGLVESRWADSKPFASFRFYDAATGKEARTFDLPLNLMRVSDDGAFSADFHWFWTGRELVDLETPRVVFAAHSLDGPAAFTPDGKTLVGAGHGPPGYVPPEILQGAVNAGGPPGIVTIHLPSPGDPGFEKLVTIEDFVRWVGITREGRVLSAADSISGGMKVWDVERKRAIVELLPAGEKATGAFVHQATFSKDAGLLATEIDSGPVLVWRLPVAR
jgi:WD40 repeat protein